MEQKKAVRRAFNSILLEVELSTHQAKVIWNHLNYLYVAGYEARPQWQKRVRKFLGIKNIPISDGWPKDKPFD